MSKVRMNDKVINRIFWSGIVLVLFLWVIQGGSVLLPGGYSGEWRHFIHEYLHVMILIYIFINIQVAGHIELKMQQHYLPAFFIAVIFTPVVSYFYYWFKQRMRS